MARAADRAARRAPQILDIPGTQTHHHVRPPEQRIGVNIFSGRMHDNSVTRKTLLRMVGCEWTDELNHGNNAPRRSICIQPIRDRAGKFRPTSSGRAWRRSCARNGSRRRRLRRRHSSSSLCRELNTLNFTTEGLRCPQSFPVGADSSLYLVHKGSHAFDGR